jgi:benzoyl-CoA reductase/2-hydroxyglutaryl-CoA dehydratase subunit BcrC/BadD/HgdB
VFLIDTPRIHDNTDKETYSRAHAYVKQQLLELIAFLEEFTGRPFNYAKFEEVVANSSRMFRLWYEALDMRRNVPSPLNVFDIFTHLFPILGLRGTVEGADYYEQFKEEVAERVANKIGPIPNERFRLHLDNAPMWFGLRELAGKFARYDASPITHVYPLLFGVFTGLDASDPVESAAKCMLKCYLNLGVKQRTDIVVEQVKRYHLDGLAMQISRTCKGLSTGVYDIIEGVEKRTGVPGVTFETDHCDPRLYSEAQVDTNLEAFFEMLASRLRVRRRLG